MYINTQSLTRSMILLFLLKQYSHGTLFVFKFDLFTFVIIVNTFYVLLHSCIIVTLSIDTYCSICDPLLKSHLMRKLL